MPRKASKGGKRRHKHCCGKRAKKSRDGSSSSTTGLAVVRVWIMGHSIVHWAGVRARESGMGPALGLPRHVHVSWFARRGMLWGELLPMVRTLMAREGPPSAIVIQLGENDLVSVGCLVLRSLILKDLEELVSTLPTTKVFWSHFLQRRVWRDSHRPAATESARKRVTAAAAHKVLSLGGAVIAHPEITFKAITLFRPDGVHLSPLGCDTWLQAVASNLKDGLGL
ncbi:uncharacterized protein LOC117052188 [Lacerta agilis]|uniref:uncharacterized protein LOC117052188 n=1 Tax=Lacerta agilis TaxID=80427 RepID=UPI00141A31E3|nr:uncharacterized protein LOC117052188 [Lacerta agilis]